MFYSLRGKLICKEEQKDFVAIECAGVSYLVYVSLNTKNQLPNEGEEVFLYTYTNIRENAVEIFGFAAEQEHYCFSLLTSVSGVGTRICLAILSKFSPNDVFSCIASNDAKLLTKTNGVGLRLASRIVLELKDKIEKTQIMNTNFKTTLLSNSLSESVKGAIYALVSLGYKEDKALEAVSCFDASLSAEELIRLSLKSMARR